MIGKGIATLGIGIAVAAIGYHEPGAGVAAMLFAILCCAAIWQ